MESNYFSMPSQRADLAVARITMTELRREAVDFTVPYDESDRTSITMLIKKATGGGNITTLEQLADVPNIQFDILPSSTHEQYFKQGTTPAAKKIWQIHQVSDVIVCTHWSEKTKYIVASIQRNLWVID